MKEFLKFTLASIVGWFVAGITFLLVGILALAGLMASASSESETVVKDNSVYLLRLSGTVVERYASSPFDKYMGAVQSPLSLTDVLASVREANDNDKCKGI